MGKSGKARQGKATQDNTRHHSNVRRAVGQKQAFILDARKRTSSQAPEGRKKRQTAERAREAKATADMPSSRPWVGLGMAWLGLAWLCAALGFALLGVALLGLAWLGLTWLLLSWLGLPCLGFALLGFAWLRLSCLILSCRALSCLVLSCLLSKRLSA